MTDSERREKASRMADRVYTVCQKVTQLVMEETEDMEPQARWLLMSRVYCGVFQNHFSLGVSAVSAKILKRQMEAEQPPSSSPPPSTL